jgi:hypothetical protein
MLHAGDAQLAGDLDAEDVARRNLDWIVARAADGPAAGRRLQADGAFGVGVCFQAIP